MEAVFLIFAAFKGAYSFFVAALNLRKLFTHTIKLFDLSDEKLSALIKYRVILMIIEASAATLMLIPPLLGIQTMKYMTLGFFIWFTAGAIEDLTEFLTHRWEQRRRQQAS